MNNSTQPLLPEIQAIKGIWLAMNSIYGHRWNSSYGLTPNTLHIDIWQQGLEGLDENQIRTGLRACYKLTDEWPPSLPQFRKLCLAIPPFILVKQNIGQLERTAFTQFVMGFLDHWQYRQADQYQAEKLLRNAYELAVYQRMNGAALPKPPTAFLANETKPKYAPFMSEAEIQANSLAAEKATKEIKEMFGWQ